MNEVMLLPKVCDGCLGFRVEEVGGLEGSKWDYLQLYFLDVEQLELLKAKW
jgi:hypothetical protein